MEVIRISASGDSSQSATKSIFSFIKRQFCVYLAIGARHLSLRPSIRMQTIDTRNIETWEMSIISVAGSYRIFNFGLLRWTRTDKCWIVKFWTFCNSHIWVCRIQTEKSSNYHFRQQQNTHFVHNLSQLYRLLEFWILWKIDDRLKTEKETFFCCIFSDSYIWERFMTFFFFKEIIAIHCTYFVRAK